MDFADLIAPVPVQAFFDETYDRLPIHLPGDGPDGERRRALLSWPGLNAILGVAGHLGEENLKLLMNGEAVPDHYYLDLVPTRGGMKHRASPAKVEAMLAMGASLVIDAAEDALFDLKQVTTMLSERFLGTSGANVYCSFRGIQAFRSHIDQHDVFAIHCEGEKLWRIYRNRLPDPVTHNGGLGRDEIEAAKGPVLMEVLMRPGDLLYIPRGYFHDALASSEASLHVTFSVTRHHAQVLFRLLEEMAMRDPAFGAWLPDGRAEDGKLLADRLDALSGKVAELMRTPAFLQALRHKQLDLVKPFRGLNLPERPQSDILTIVQRPWRIDQRGQGGVLVLQNGEVPLGPLEDAARWLLRQSFVSIDLLLAHFPQHGEAALRDLVQVCQRAGLIQGYRPAGATVSNSGHITASIGR